MKEILFSMGLLIIGIVVLVMLHICIVGRLFRAEQGRSNAAGAVRFGTSARKITIDDLTNLPCFDHVGGEEADCAICLDNFKAGDKCRSLPNCRHYFHAPCIDSWLLKTPICPICRNCIAMASTKRCMILEKEEGVVVPNHVPRDSLV